MNVQIRSSGGILKKGALLRKTMETFQVLAQLYFITAGTKLAYYHHR